MSCLVELTNHLSSANPLSAPQISQALKELQNTDVPIELRAGFLSAWRKRGETAEEIANLVKAVLAQAVTPWDGSRPEYPFLVDVCGTGADKLNTFNVSTAVMFVLAAAGVPVAKHGNRAISSQCGSADVLEELGIKVDAAPEITVKCLREIGCAFFLAQAYHPAFKNIAPVRKYLAEKGEVTVFNILGPLVNPARPNAQLIGIFSPVHCSRLIQVLKLMGHKRAVTVHGTTEDGRGMDELSISGPNSGAQLHEDGTISELSFSSASLGLPSAPVASLKGGNRQENAAILMQVLSSTEENPRVHAVLLNAAYGLWVAGKVSDANSGIQEARKILLSGRALNKLKEMVNFYRSIKN